MNVKKKLFLLLTVITVFTASPMQAQIVEGAYKFEKILVVPFDSVISQGHTGTCWSFATTSFLESEIYKKTGQWIDLSEMYNVRRLYLMKMLNYVGRQGKAQFGAGGLSHDVIKSFKKYGVVPESVYNGLKKGQSHYDYSKLSKTLKAIAQKAVEDVGLRMKIKAVTNKTLNKFMGQPPKKFKWQGKTYTPKSFAESLPINPSDYVEFTSFGFQPYYSKFILNIPDNYNNGAYWNVPLDSLTVMIDEALKKGFSVALDCDVSENTFLRKPIQIGVFPKDKTLDIIHHIVPESWISPAQRDRNFWAYRTTDDHLIQVVGLYRDQKGNEYYKIKNSWGTDYLSKGYWMLSKAYVRAKAIGIMVNKAAVNEALAQKTFKK